MPITTRVGHGNCDTLKRPASGASSRGTTNVTTATTAHPISTANAAG